MNTTHTQLSQIVSGVGGLDAHMWLEKDDGTIIDYPDSALKKVSAYGTNKIVRKPFSKELQLQVLPYIMKKIQNSPRLPESIFKNTPGFCFNKAYLEKRDQKNKDFKYVIGSLGFQQHDGSVFYEYG